MFLLVFKIAEVAFDALVPLPFRTRAPPAAVAKLVAFVFEEEVSASGAGRGVRSGRTRDSVLVLGKSHAGGKRQRQSPRHRDEYNQPRGPLHLPHGVPPFVSPILWGKPFTSYKAQGTSRLPGSRLRTHKGNVSLRKACLIVLPPR